MGLLLSVLVVCVGVLEVIACVRHFQDGYLPLWTPHCAVTSGYTNSRELWRKKPSGSFEFRSANDVCEASNYTEDHQSKTYLETSQHFFNDVSGKQQFGETDYDKSTEESENLPTERYEKNKVHISDDVLGDENIEVNLTEKSAENVNEKNSADISENDFVSCTKILQREDDINEHYLVLTSGSVVESEVSPPVLLKESKNDEIVHDFNENYSRTVSGLNIEFEDSVPDAEGQLYSHGDSFADIKSLQQFAPHEAAFPSEKTEVVSRPTASFDKEAIPGDISVPNVGSESLIEAVETITDFHKNLSSFNAKESNEISSDFADKYLYQESPEIPVLESGEVTEKTGVQQNVPLSHYQNDSEIPLADEQIHEKFCSSDDQSKFPASDTETYLSDVGIEKIVKENKLQEDQQWRMQERFTEKSTTEQDFNTEADKELKPNVITEQISPVETNVNIEEQFLDRHLSIQTNFDLPDESVEANKDHYNVKPCLSFESGTSDEKQFYVEEALRLKDNVAADMQDDVITEEQKITEVDVDVKDETTELCPSAKPPVSLQEEVSFELYSATDENKNLQSEVEVAQHDIVNQNNEPEPSSPSLENEDSISDNVETIRNDASESRLSIQTTKPEPQTPEKHPNEDIPDDTVISQVDDQEDISEVQSSSFTSFTPSPKDNFHEPTSPIAIDTTYRSSMSPPKAPSTPRKSKADISWPTFFPGTPVIKRPSVSFATPEAVFTPEDQELLQQYEEESSTLPPCIKKADDTSIATDSEATTTSTTEEKSTESTGLSDRSDSIEEEEEDLLPTTYKERSPSNIVAGNDFSRKELQLQRRKSYKHKRYSSATEISSRDEQAEDRSFSEDKKGIVRASSVREPRRRHRLPAKASSFEDVLLRDTKTESHGESNVKSSIETKESPIFEGGELETQDPQLKDDAGDEELKKRDTAEVVINSGERNESKSLESKPSEDVARKNETAVEEKKHSKQQDEGVDDYSVSEASEDQSSSRQTSPRNEAFWVSSEDDTH